MYGGYDNDENICGDFIRLNYSSSEEIDNWEEVY